MARTIGNPQPSTLNPQPALCRLRDVMETTGWSEKYVAKLVEAGVLKSWRCRKGRRWYYTAQIQKLIQV